MNNIINNLITLVLGNLITVTFLLVTTVYSIYKIVENKVLYDYINNYLKDLNDNKRTSIFFNQILELYNDYGLETNFSEINITSLVEEVASGFMYKKKFVLDKIKSLKNASSICILLGVLGTFVGLSMMLLMVNTKDIINSLPNTISNMQTAFTTSIIGVVFSLLIGYSTKAKDCEHCLLQLMLKLENLLTAEVTHSKGQIMNRRVEDLDSTIKSISKSMEAVENFDIISKDLNNFNTQFIGNIQSLKNILDKSEDSIKTLVQGIRMLNKEFNILNIKFENIFDTYENQGQINNEMLLEMKDCTKHIYESTDINSEIKNYIENINSEFIVYKTDIKDMLDKLYSDENKMTLSQSALNEQGLELENCIKSVSNIVTVASEDIQNKLDMIFNYIDIYSEAIKVAKSSLNEHETINTNPDEKFINEEIYEIDNEEELNIKNMNKFTVIKAISEDNLYD